MSAIKSAVVAIVVTFAPASVWAAYLTVPYVIQKEAKSGVPLFLGSIYNCQDHVPFSGDPFVSHGKVFSKPVTISACGNATEPARAVWYISDKGYVGLDEVNFPGRGGSALIAEITVR